MKDKLYVIIKYKELINNYSNLSLIFPRKYYYLKDMLEQLLFDNLKDMYIINNINDKDIRVLRKSELIGRVLYLNYLFEQIESLKIISRNKFDKIHKEIEVIYKLLIGWSKV